MYKHIFIHSMAQLLKVRTGSTSRAPADYTQTVWDNLTLISEQ